MSMGQMKCIHFPSSYLLLDGPSTRSVHGLESDHADSSSTNQSHASAQQHPAQHPTAKNGRRLSIAHLKPSFQNRVMAANEIKSCGPSDASCRRLRPHPPCPATGEAVGSAEHVGATAVSGPPPVSGCTSSSPNPASSHASCLAMTTPWQAARHGWRYVRPSTPHTTCRDSVCGGGEKCCCCVALGSKTEM
jgi:hypothetical protein